MRRIMEFVVFSQPIAAALWLAVYILAVPSCLARRGGFVVAIGCGIATAAATVATLVFGGELLELAVELVILAAICLVCRGCRREL